MINVGEQKHSLARIYKFNAENIKLQAVVSFLLVRRMDVCQTRPSGPPRGITTPMVQNVPAWINPQDTVSKEHGTLRSKTGNSGCNLILVGLPRLLVLQPRDDMEPISGWRHTEFLTVKMEKYFYPTGERYSWRFSSTFFKKWSNCMEPYSLWLERKSKFVFKK